MIAALLAVALTAFGPDPFLAGNPWVLRGHTGTVVAVALTADGRLAASAGREGDVRVWDLTTGATTVTVPGAEQQISVLRFSADGSLLAIGETALKVRVVAVADGALRDAWAHPDSVSDVAWSPDGALLAVAGHAGNGAVFALGAEKPVSTFRGRSACFLAGGARLLVANAAGSLSVLDARTGRERQTRSTAPWLPYATCQADLVATWDGASVDVRTFSARTLKQTGVLVGPGPQDTSLRRPRVLAVVIDRGARQLLTLTGDGFVRLWDVASRTALIRWPSEQASGAALGRGWVAVADGAIVKLWKRPEAP